MIIKMAERLLHCLQGRIAQDSRAFLTKDEALETLRRISGLDFGDDATAWERWIEENSEKIDNYKQPQ